MCFLCTNSLLNVCLYKIFYLIAKKCKEKCPVIHCFFCDNVNKWRYSRYTFGIIFGIFSAVIFWDIFIVDLFSSPEVAYGLLLFLILLLGIGYPLSCKLRCITLLTCLAFFGKSGRSYFRAITFAMIIGGPIANLALNGKEIIRVFACSTVLTYNLTKTRYDLMSKPFLNALAGMKENVSEAKATFAELQDVVEPIKSEVENDDISKDSSNSKVRRSTRNQRDSPFDPNDNSVNSAEYYRNRYIEKMRKRCELQLSKGEQKCKGAFQKTYDDCYEKLPTVINTLLCWPMKITFICNIQLFGFSKGKNGVCDPSNVVSRDFGENYVNLQDTENKFVSNASETSVDYTFVNPKELPGAKTATETSKAIVNEFNEKKTLFDKYMFIVKRILSFIFIKIIIESVIYHNKYLKKIDFDNFFITNYFKKIDKRRKEKGQSHLLPLKKIEQNFLIDSLASKRTKIEKQTKIAHSLKFFIEFLTSAIFLLLDYIIYILLIIVADNAKISYQQEGDHTVIVVVNGTGIIASLIRSTLRGFNTSETISTVLTNEQCLPKPTILSNWFYFKLFSFYSTILCLICNEFIMLRLRRLICEYFYPKREKRRILFLYNNLLKRRKAIFEMMYETVSERLLKEEYKISVNILTKIRLRFPTLFSCLRNFKWARRQCLICEEPEPKKYDPKRPFNFADCKTLGCYAVFCEECWFEIGEVCLACQIRKKKPKSAQEEDECE